MSRKQRRVTGSLSHAEHRARTAATARGLFLLFEGTGAGRTWRIYGGASGKVLGFFTPATGRYHIGEREGRGLDGDAVLDIAADLARQG